MEGMQMKGAVLNIAALACVHASVVKGGKVRIHLVSDMGLSVCSGAIGRYLFGPHITVE